MNVTLRLATDFIERAASADYGSAVNEEYALRWLMLRSEGDVMGALGITELGPQDIHVLSLDSWLWLGANLGANDPELPSALVEALFTATEDPVYRLRIADISLRHPSLSERYEKPSRRLFEAPPSWGRDRLIRLSGGEADQNGLIEMTAILLQIGNRAALRLLSGLRRETPDVVEETLGSLTGRQGEALSRLISDLGLADLE